MSIERHVARIADPGNPRAADAHRLGQQGDLRQADLQGAGLTDNAAIGKGVDQVVGLVTRCGDAKRAGEDRGAVGGDIRAVIVAAGESQVETEANSKVRSLIAEQATCSSVPKLVRRVMDWSVPHRLMRLTLKRTRGLAPVWPLGVHL